MTEEEFQRDIEQPFRRYLDGHSKLLAGMAGAAAMTQIARGGGDKEEKLKAMAAAWKRAHDAFGVEAPWEAMPDEIRAHRPEAAREYSKGE